MQLLALDIFLLSMQYCGKRSWSCITCSRGRCFVWALLHRPEESCRHCEFWGRTSELKFGVFGRKELHQVRPDWHHSHGDGTQSGNAACAGAAGRPAHTGAEKKGATTLTLSLTWSQQDDFPDCSPESLQAPLWISCCFQRQSSGEHPFLPRLSSICSLEALAVGQERLLTGARAPGVAGKMFQRWVSRSHEPLQREEARHVGSHLNSYKTHIWGNLSLIQSKLCLAAQ